MVLEAPAVLWGTSRWWLVTVVINTKEENLPEVSLASTDPTFYLDLTTEI